MGNEMGNNNTSGLQEEDNTTVETKEKSLQEAVHADDLKNYVISAVQGKDAHEKETGLPSDDPNGEVDPQVDNKTSNGREEDKKTVETKEKSLQEAVHADDLQNDVIPVAQGKDAYEETWLPSDNPNGEVETGLPSDDPNGEVETWLPSDDPNGEVDPQVDDKTSNGGEQEQTKVHPPDESPKVEVKANEAGSENSDIQSACSSNNLENDEKSKESTLEENQSEDSETSDHQHDKQTREDEGETNFNSDTISTSSDPERQEPSHLKSDQPEFTKVDTNQSVQDGTGSSLTRTSEVNDHLLDTNISSSPGGSVLSDSNLEVEKERGNLSVKEMLSKEEKVSSEEKIDIKDGDDVGNSLDKIISTTTDLPSGVGIKHNEELSTEMNPNTKHSSESQPEASPTDESLDSHLEISEPEDKCMVPNEETILVGKESENGENKHDQHQTQSLQESIKGSKIDGAVASESEIVMIGSDQEDSKNSIGETFDLINNKTCQSKEAKVSEDILLVDVPVNNQSMAPEQHCKNSEDEETKVVENGHLVDGNQNEALDCEPNCRNSKDEEAKVVENGHLVNVPANNNKASEQNSDDEETKFAENGHLFDVPINNQEEEYEQHCETSEGETSVVITEIEIVGTKLSLSDCKFEEEEAKENSTIEEIVDKQEDREEKEGTESCISQLVPVEQTETILPVSPASLAHSEDHQQEIEVASHDEEDPSNKGSISELKKESAGEFFVTKASTFNLTNLIKETLVPVAELASEKPRQAETVAETKTAANQSSGQCERGEASGSAVGDGYEAQESVERFSTESNPDNMNIHPQIRKSPSFGFDLRIKARAEESDQTPLLYQDKAAIESLSSQADINFNNQFAHNDYGQNLEEYQAMPVEGKVVSLERSDSEKSRTPFLGFLKEEEEARILVTSQKQENYSAAKKATKDLLNSHTKEVASNSPKRKEKRRARSSLFGTCMCCATVTN